MSLLEDEIKNDPLARGYDGMTDQQVASDMHIKYRPENRKVWTSIQVQRDIDAVEYGDLTASKVNQLIGMLAIPELAWKFLIVVIGDIFPMNSATETNLLASRSILISRDKDLGLPVTRPGKVKEARG